MRPAQARMITNDANEEKKLSITTRHALFVFKEQDKFDT